MQNLLGFSILESVCILLPFISKINDLRVAIRGILRVSQSSFPSAIQAISLRLYTNLIS